MTVYSSTRDNCLMNPTVELDAGACLGYQGACSRDIQFSFIQ